MPGPLYRPVRELPPEVARKIAAGEVIDRPAAIVRELLDNAVDAGAENIIVEIEEGGVQKVRVADDGFGMTKDDLEHCARPHGTSKIHEEIDLLNISTLGFRGEALASIAAVSRLTLTTARNNEAWRLFASITGRHRIEAAHLSRGTIAESESLFEDVPARRHFLKRPASEAAACRQVFVEKAIPWPDIAFRFVSDGAIKLDLPAGQSPAERFADALQSGIDPRLLSLLRGEAASSDTSGKAADGGRFSLLIGDPVLSRPDRKFIFIYVNNRRINDFALIQAIEYGASGFFPNGTHPVAALFLEMDPSLVDFNIHPAKKEARFKEIGPAPRAISSTVRQFFHHAAVKSVRDSGENLLHHGLVQPQTGWTPQWTARPQGGTPRRGAPGSQAGGRPREEPYQPSPGRDFFRDSFAYLTPPASPQDVGQGVRYLGTVFGVFIVAEEGETVYFIDHHATHERILYDQFIAAQGQRQTLLFPYVIETADETEDAYLESLKDALFAAGFEVRACGGGRWEAVTVPVLWIGAEEDLQEDLLQKRLAPEDVLAAFAATCACRGAIKEGDAVDAETALFIAREALALENPRCPHGRPLYFAVTREQLYRAVKRT
jgi:DNA mismatch repair protein MutL